MGDLTRTFGGLIIFAHRANSQSLYNTATIHVYTRYACIIIILHACNIIKELQLFLLHPRAANKPSNKLSSGFAIRV